MFWRDRTTTNDAGEEVPYPPVSQDVGAFFVEGNALMLVQDELSSYLIPLDTLEAVSIERKVVDEANSGDDNRDETSDESSPAKIITPNFSKEG